MPEIRVAVVGIGNCASSLLQVLNTIEMPKMMSLFPV